MVVKGVHVEDIFELVSLVLSLIISWTFRILVMRKTNTLIFLSIAFKQTKAWSQSSGTPFPVCIDLFAIQIMAFIRLVLKLNFNICLFFYIGVYVGLLR